MQAQESLELAYQPVRTEIDQVEEELRACRPEGYGAISDSIDYILESEGKRIRPALVILSAKACGLNGSGDVVKMAAAAELFHTATLVSDDILDGAALRRGKDTVNCRWGTETAIMSAQYLYLSALTKTSEIGLNGMSSDYSRLMLDTARTMLSGEIKDHEVGKRGRLLSEKEYLGLVRAKTAVLFSACSRAGAMLAEADNEVDEAMTSYGENLGIAFQIADDVLDFTADETLLGKPVGADVRGGKMTLPLIHHIRSLGRSERRGLLQDSIAGKNIEDLRSSLERTGSLDYSLHEAKRYVTIATGLLNVLGESDYKRSLVALSRHAVERKR
jgi:octaprenyl-diphosphate synthase